MLTFDKFWEAVDVEMEAHGERSPSQRNEVWPRYRAPGELTPAACATAVIAARDRRSARV